MGVTLLLGVGTYLLLLLPERTLAASLSVQTATTILGVIAAVYFLCTALLVVALFCLCCRGRGRQCRIFPYKGKAYTSPESVELPHHRTPDVFRKAKEKEPLPASARSNESKVTRLTEQTSSPAADHPDIAVIENESYGLSQESDTIPQSTNVAYGRREVCETTPTRREVHETNETTPTRRGVHETTPTRDSQLLQNHTYEQIQDDGVTGRENPWCSDDVFDHTTKTPERTPKNFDQAKEEASVKRKRKGRTDSSKPLLNGSESRCSESSSIEEPYAPSPLPEEPEDMCTPQSTPSHKPADTSMTARERPRPSRTSATGALGDLSFSASGYSHSADGISGRENPGYGMADLSGEGDVEGEVKQSWL